jgi:EmrB/QacA subfamily drug resistance transporter
LSEMQHPPVDFRLRRAALIIATMSSFLTPFMASSVNVALPSIGQEFGLSAVVLSWIPTAYLLAAAMFLVPFGRISDISGRKRIFVIGIVIDAIASLLGGLSPTAAWLITFRVLQGIGGAMIFGTGIAILTSVYPPKERGRVLGINAAAVYAGLSFGPPASGLLTAWLGWRSIFFTNMILGLIIFSVTLWGLRGEWHGAKGEKLDLPGSVIYSLSLFAVMYGFSELPAWYGWLLLAGGIVGVAGFILWESRAEQPVLDIRLFRNNSVFAFSNLAALINYSATAASGFLMSIYLQSVKGLSPEKAGLVLIFQPVLMSILSPIAGRLSDRVEPRWISSVGMILTTIGLVMLTFLNAASGLVLVFVSLAVLGAGFGLFSSPNTNAIMSAVERRSYGVASATLGTMRLIGQTLSLGIAMLLFSFFMGQLQITPESQPLFLAAMRTAYIIFAVLCFGGIFASLARGEMHGKGAKTL